MLNDGEIKEYLRSLFLENEDRILLADIGREKTWSYKNFLEEAIEFKGSLEDLLSSGNAPLVMMAENIPQAFFTYFATLLMNKVLVPINPLLSDMALVKAPFS